MQEKITPNQALIALYNACKLAPLKADDHAMLAECAKILDAIINPPKEDVKKK